MYYAQEAAIKTWDKCSIQQLIVRSAFALKYNGKVPQWNSDGKFGSFYWLGPLSLVQQNERIFFRVISFISLILAKYNSNVTCYFPNTSTTYVNTNTNTKI